MEGKEKKKRRKTTEGERPEMRSDRPPLFAASAVSTDALNYGSLEARERMRNAGREQQTGGCGGEGSKTERPWRKKKLSNLDANQDEKEDTSKAFFLSRSTMV